MKTGSVFLRSLTLLTSLLVISAALLTISVKPGLTAGEQDVREHGPTTTIRGVVVDEKGQPLQGIIVRCADPSPQEEITNQTVILGETLSGEQGEFTLTIPRNAAKKIECSIGDGNIYETKKKIIAADRDTQVVFTLRYRTILELESWVNALILLIPGMAVPGLLAFMSWWWRGDPDRQRLVGDTVVVLASFVFWGATFATLWLFLQSRDSSGLHFFHPALSLASFVPIFGFIGALIFVIDLFPLGTQGGPPYREFALRLALGPYVAIVMVLLLSGILAFFNLSIKPSGQATMAFFSGFLGVLVIQSLTEKGDEILGQWRATSRYEPSEIARSFNLAYDEDIKLQKANMKYLEQLRILSEDDLKTIAKQIDLGEGFLVGLQRQLQRNENALAERLEKSVSNQIESLLSEPTLDNFQGTCCVMILNGEGVEMSSHEDGVLVVSPGQSLQLSVQFHPGLSEPSSGYTAMPISIRDGHNAEQVIFEVSLDSDTVPLPDTIGRFVTASPRAPSTPLLFELVAPEQSGLHTIWVSVFQKNKLIQVVSVPISIVELGTLPSSKPNSPESTEPA
jgi:hypothetical protein